MSDHQQAESSEDQLLHYRKRVGEVAPDLAITSISLNSEGLLNDVVIVNNELVFRFPKHEYAKKHLQDEIRLLKLLQNQITLNIPTPLNEGSDWLVYRMIQGEPLRRDLLLRLSEQDQQAIADQLAVFLKELHNVPTNSGEFPVADALMKHERWLDVYGRIKEQIFPLLMPHVRVSVAEHFETHLAKQSNFDYELKLVDTDLPPYHILFDPNARRLNGIIDFGCAGLGDPAIDLGVIIYNYGESFVDRFYRVYPEAESYLKRARFYAGAHEVRWLLRGIESNNFWWFAVHVGSAKDMRLS